jgi:GNAT superfamily N-acetyltransferase
MAGMDLPPPTFGPPPEPTADASVRAARPEDAAAIGAVQAAAWRASYTGVLPEPVLAALDPAELAEIWHRSIAAPPSRAHRVLVALEAGEVIGFAATAPSADGNEANEASGVGEVATLLVRPEAQGRGHGSRLLNAAVDRLRDNGFDHAVVWVVAGDDARLRFLTGAGFAADGAHRGLDLTGDGSSPLREQRLVASLAPPG